MATDKDVLYRFKEIEKIPRGSGNEREISNFLVDFAKERDLEVRQDEANNVVIKKAATKGYENAPTAALQGHMDMVCVKNSDVDHDFTKDPIELVEEDGRLHAKGTTLGADDGMAVAMALAILDSDEISHGPLEVVITTDEERSMGGANKLDTSDLKAKYFLNIDSEEEGVLTVGCAGGIEVEASFDKPSTTKADNLIKIDLKDFEGGHSGMAIDQYKVNAIKALARMINSLPDYRISEIYGGVKKNSIPMTATCILSTSDPKKGLEILKKEAGNILHEAKFTDPKGDISVEEVKGEAQVYSSDFSRSLIEFLFVRPDGLYRKDTETGEILTSSNIGLLEDRKECFVITSFVRSNISSDKVYRAEILKKIGEKYGAKIDLVNGYPGWEKEDSQLLKKAAETWEKLTGKAAKIAQTHGGLECGLLKDKMADTQFISFGPNIVGAHSTKEKADLKSIDRVYEFVKTMLAELK